MLLPDVYYRDGDWAPFDMATVFGDPDERNRLLSMIGSLTPDKMTSDAAAFFDYLAARPEVSGERVRRHAATAWAGGSRWWWPAASPSASRPRRRSTAAAW